MQDSLSSAPRRILVIDDDRDVLQAATLLLTRNGFQVTAADSPSVAWGAIGAEAFDAILLDLNFARGETSGREGLDFLSEVLTCAPQSTVVVITGHSGISVAVQAMRAGAADFITKPWSNQRLVAALDAALELRQAATPNTPPTESRDGTSEIPILLGASDAIQRVNAKVNSIARTQASALIVGEPGVGKTLVARAIHWRSDNGGAAFVTADMEAPDDWLARSVFGATEDAAFQRANGGTLLLQEVGALSPAAQAQLLAFLDSPAASGRVRLLSTSRRPLIDLQAPGGLRPALLDRLGAVSVSVPPLRERREDILPLAAHFIAVLAQNHGRAPKALSAEAAGFLARNDWPDNVRGLRRIIENAVVLSEGEHYEIADLALGERDVEAPHEASDLNLGRVERGLIEAALRRRNFNVSHAARDLGLTRATLYRRMVKHGL